MTYKTNEILIEYGDQTGCEIEALGQIGRFGPEEKMRVFIPEPLRLDSELNLIPPESLLWKIKVE